MSFQHRVDAWAKLDDLAALICQHRRDWSSDEQAKFDTAVRLLTELNESLATPPVATETPYTLAPAVRGRSVIRD